MEAIRFFHFASLVCWLGCVATTHAQPRLAVTNTAAGASLGWSASATNWVLEQAQEAVPAVRWQGIANSNYTRVGEVLLYRPQATSGSSFFRLRRAGTGVSPSQVPDLLAAWSFEEGAGSVALAGAEVDAPLWLTNVVWGEGRCGISALRFNGGPADGSGSRARLDLGRTSLPAAESGPFSVSFWMNPEAQTNGWRHLVGTALTATNGWQIALQTAGPGTNRLVASGAGAGGLWSVAGETVLLPGQWRQVTFTHDGVSNRLYLDGGALASGAGGVRPAQGPLWFGGGVTGRPAFLGRLDELRLYTNALPAERIRLAGAWDFDEGSGSEAADTGLLARPAHGLVEASWVTGTRGHACDLAVGQVLIANGDADLLPLNGEPFSLSFWLRLHSPPSGRGELLACADAAGGWRVGLETGGNGQLWLRWTATNGGTLDLAAPVTLPPDLWTKLDLTFDGGQAAAYVNGRRVQTACGSIRGTRAALALGAATGAMSCAAAMDELRVYRYERSVAEIGPVGEVMWETALIGTTTNLVLRGAGPTGHAVTFALAAPSPTRGTVTLDPMSGIATYHAGTVKGRDSFAYTVSDGEFTSPPTSVMVSVVQPHWLAPAGGSESPRDGTTPARAWVAGPAAALDAIWRTNNSYDAFFYSPGVFETTGYRYGTRSTANPGCKHYGSGPSGPEATTLRLVDTWEASAEGCIFSGYTTRHASDDFEVHRLVLDCNATNNPKLTIGEPVWLRLPLVNTARVDTVTLRWGAWSFVNIVPVNVGRPAQFTLCGRTATNGTVVTNCQSFPSTNIYVDTVPVGNVTDELTLLLTQRPSGVDFYGLQEIEVAGARVSLPTATNPDGVDSRLDPYRSIMSAVDGNSGTAWASGPDALVQLTFPFAAGTAVDRLNLEWNCQTLTNVGWLGPAADLTVLARDTTTDQLVPVPFVRHGRATNGLEVITLGTPTQTNAVVTRELAVWLTSPEAGVSRYSLREVSCYRGATRVGFRLPSALNQLNGNYGVLRALDGDLQTGWASASQGMLGAVDVRGSNLKFTQLAVVGFGTRALRECFPFYVGAPSSLPPASNVLVAECVFRDPAPSAQDGLTVVTVAGQGTGQLRNAVVRRCTVSGVRPYFAKSKAFTAAWVEDCLVDNCEMGVYFEPQPGVLESIGPVLVRSNAFLNVVNGVYLSMHPSSAFDSLTVLDNEIVLAGTGQRGWGVACCDTCRIGPPGTITNVVVLRNRLRYPDWSARPSALDSGLLYSDIQHAIFGGNLVQLGTTAPLQIRSYPAGSIPAPVPVEDCDHPNTLPPGSPTIPLALDSLPVGYRRAWFENHDLTGALLPVWFAYNGKFRLALQQQWP